MEMVEKYDNKRRFLNKIDERHNKIPNEYKQSMHVWIMNNNGELLIQKRSKNKESYPDMWAITSGSTLAGESTLQTVIRECKEELSIDVDINKLELMLTIKSKYNFTDVWLLRQEIDINSVIMQEEEVADVKWVTESEFEKMIEMNEVASSIEFYYDFLKKLWNL